MRNKQDESGQLICGRWCISGICEKTVSKVIQHIGYCTDCAVEVEGQMKRQARRRRQQETGR